MLKLGSATISKIMLGSSEIVRAYVGADKVYESASIPENIVPPVLSGMSFHPTATWTSLGVVSVANNGLWTGDPTAFEYKWQYDAVDIDGQTASSINRTGTGDQQNLRCMVRAGNTAGWSDWVPSNELYVIEMALFNDSTDTTTISHTTNSVSGWSDLSGHGNHATQTNAARQMLTNTDTVGGKNVLTTDIGKGLVYPSGLYDVNLDDWTHIQVYQKTSLTAGSSAHGLYSGYRWGARTGEFSSARITGYVTNGSNGWQECRINGADTAQGLFGITAYTCGGTTARGYRNGPTLTGTATISGPNTTPLSSLTWGMTGASDGIQGLLAAVMIARRVLTNAELNLIGNSFKDGMGAAWANV